MNYANPGTVVMRDLARAFLTPRPPRTATGLDFLPGGRRVWVDGPAGQVAAATAGEGPAVLLVHGWEGQARDLGAFASPLIEAGYRVIAVELPAHGQSAGTQTSIPQAADALLAVQRVMGNLHAAIAHSVGAAVLTQAMRAGLEVGRVALVAAPAEYADYARAFAAQVGLGAAGADSMISELLSLGVDVHAVSLPRAASSLTQPALFVHSSDDQIVPIRDAEAGVRAWKSASLVRFEGLGHRRILAAPEVVQAILSFVAGRSAERY